MTPFFRRTVLHHVAGLLMTGLLLGVPPSAWAQLNHSVGLQLGWGRSYQIGTPGGSIARPYQRFRSGANTLFGIYYENARTNSPWVLRGGLHYTSRSYWIVQDRFANRWFREAKFQLQHRYELASFNLSGGYRFIDRERLKVEAFAGLVFSYGALESWYTTSQYEGAYVTPLEYSERYREPFDSTITPFTLIEPIAGLHLRWRSKSRFLNRFSYWLVCSWPTSTYDDVMYRLTETYRNESTTYEGRWRTRLANWTLGLSFDLWRWEP